MATSAASSIFARELLELRLSGALMAAFENWSRLAVNAVIRDLTPEVREAFLRSSVLAAVPDEYRDVAAAYFEDFQMLGDAVEVLTEVRQYALARGMGEEATRSLMREAIAPGRGRFAPLPVRMLEQTRVRELVPVGTPSTSPIPEHPALLAPEVPFAEYGQTYSTRIDYLGRTVATSLSGRAMRDLAQRTGSDLRWVTTGDNRVRETHQRAQGQTVASDEWFQIGGVPMEFPGDPSAPRDEIANCRCVLTLVEPAERRYVQRYVPREWLNAAATGNLARLVVPRSAREAAQAAPTGTVPSGPVGLLASAPAQARAPKGTPIGGQWIDTPLTILDKIMLESKGLPVPEDPKYRNAQALADDYAARLTEAWNDPSIEVTVNGVSGGTEYGTKFMAVITDRETGESVGDFERTFYADGHVHHDQFRLNEDYQGRGMGSKMQAVSEDFYRELGYDRIELKAGLDVGGYTWAKQGYEFQGQLTAYDVSYFAWDQITRGAVAGVTPESRQAAIDIFHRAQAEAQAAGNEDTSYIPSGILPAEIAMIGWTPGATMWPGKEVLLGYEWEGVKHLNPGSVTAAADVDRAAALGALHRDWVGTAAYASRPVPRNAESWYPNTEEDVYTDPVSDDEFWTAAAKVLTPPAGNVPSPAPGAGLSAQNASMQVFVQARAVGSAPAQARAPRGTPIGGQWIDTPSAVLHYLGWAGESPDTADTPYDVVPATPPPNVTPDGYRRGLDKMMPGTENLTIEQMEAVEEYTGQGGFAMNNYLRTGDVGMAYKNTLAGPPQEHVDMLDSAFSGVPGDLHTYRGVGPMLNAPDPDALVGKVIRDEGYLSTTLNANVATSYFGGYGPDKGILKITVPKGTPGIWPENMAVVSGEMELILPHGLNLAITGWYDDPKLGTRVYEATVATPTNPSLTAAAPTQARAPKGTPIGGEWIDTPGAMLKGIGVRNTLTLGFADPAAVAKARDAAKAKEAALPEPTDADRAAATARHGKSKRQGGDDRPGSQRRKVLRQRLLDEFGDGKTCPCLNCGRTLDITTVSMDRIIPGAENGRYNIENLIPMDYDCNRARSDSDFDEMASTWAEAPVGDEPAATPGTLVRANPSGWGRDASGDLDGADDAPSLEGVPEWIEGPLEVVPVDAYLKHIVAGYDVDPATIEESAP